MAKKEKDKANEKVKESKPDNDKSKERRHFLARYILDKLGKPKNFRKIDIANVYDNRYRVNVKASDGSIPHSFFVRLSKDNEVTFIDPEINRRY